MFVYNHALQNAMVYSVPFRFSGHPCWYEDFRHTPYALTEVVQVLCMLSLLPYRQKKRKSAGQVLPITVLRTQMSKKRKSAGQLVLLITVLRSSRKTVIDKTDMGSRRHGHPTHKQTCLPQDENQDEEQRMLRRTGWRMSLQWKRAPLKLLDISMGEGCRKCVFSWDSSLFALFAVNVFLIQYSVLKNALYRFLMLFTKFKTMQ